MYLQIYLVFITNGLFKEKFESKRCNDFINTKRLIYTSMNRWIILFISMISIHSNLILVRLSREIGKAYILCWIAIIYVARKFVLKLLMRNTLNNTWERIKPLVANISQEISPQTISMILMFGIFENISMMINMYN